MKGLVFRMINFIKNIFLYIHTILLFVGIAFIAVSAFLYSLIVGFLVLGVCCIGASVLISREMG